MNSGEIYRVVKKNNVSKNKKKKDIYLEWTSEKQSGVEFNKLWVGSHRKVPYCRIMDLNLNFTYIKYQLMSWLDDEDQSS